LDILSQHYLNKDDSKATGATIGSCAGVYSATLVYMKQIDSSLLPFMENVGVRVVHPIEL